MTLPVSKEVKPDPSVDHTGREGGESVRGDRTGSPHRVVRGRGDGGAVGAGHGTRRRTDWGTSRARRDRETHRDDHHSSDRGDKEPLVHPDVVPTSETQAPTLTSPRPQPESFGNNPPLKTPVGEDRGSTRHGFPSSPPWMEFSKTWERKEVERKKRE